ncbi:MAG: SUMF1/EgtB/PvdO family nonheme iron enzyme [Alphaproteobacteria bacterium]
MVFAVVFISRPHMPTCARAVTWPIERRFFEDKIPERRLGSENAGKSWTDPVLRIRFVLLPAGCFDMGDAAAGIVGKVYVDDLFFSQHEITNAQFRRFRSTHNSGAHAGRSLDGDDQPAVNISWQDAMAFAAWLSDETGTPFRLPTEAEWEYACGYGWRGGSTGKADTDGNLRENSDEQETDGTVAVGSYGASPRSISDMHGNASEWELDSYINDVDRYGDDRHDPRIEAAATPLRVRRGGDWASSKMQARCAARDDDIDDLAVPYTGFRLVAQPQE